MKKLIVLLLASVMCLSLCACGGGNDTSETKGNEENSNTTESQNETTDAAEQNIDILGEWVWVGDNTNTLTFNEDNTCLYSNGDSVKYSIDIPLAIITLYDDTTKNYDIIEEKGIVKISGSKVYVRAEDYEISHAEYIEAENARQEAAFQDEIRKLEALHSALGTKYVFGTAMKATEADIDITIMSAEFAPIESELHNFDMAIWLTVKYENNTDEEQWAPNLIMSKSVMDSSGMTYLGEYSSVISTGGGWGLDWRVAVNENGDPVDENGDPGKASRLPAHSTITVKIPYRDGWEYDDFQKCTEYNGHMNGFFSFIGGGISYYIDMADMPISE